MASQTQGIMQLLTAEKRAAEKINDARKRKTQRLKQAKQEAQAEVEKYRQVSSINVKIHHSILFQERERQFKEYEQQYLGTKEDIEAGIVRETEAELASMQKNVASNKQQVIVRLLQLVSLSSLNELHLFLGVRHSSRVTSQSTATKEARETVRGDAVIRLCSLWEFRQIFISLLSFLSCAGEIIGTFFLNVFRDEL
jgi:V-type H+-transporting ATPase subunit G